MCFSLVRVSRGLAELSPGKRSVSEEPRRRRPTGDEGSPLPNASCLWPDERGECGLKGVCVTVGEFLPTPDGEAEGGGEGYDCGGYGPLLLTGELWLPLFSDTDRLTSDVVLLDKEPLRYGFVLDRRRPICCLGGACTGGTVPPARKLFPGPSSWEGSGAFKGSRRYFVAWERMSALWKGE